MLRNQGGEVPRQQLLDAVDGMIGDAFEHVAQIEFWIKAIQLGCAQESIDRSRAFSAGIRTGEEVDDMTAMWSWRRQWLS